MKVLFILLTLLYPVGVFYGLAAFSVKEVSLVLLVFFLLRLIVTQLNTKRSQANENNSDGKSTFPHLAIAIPVISILLFSYIFDNDIGVLFYPVIVNASLATLFLNSLFSPPPIIEKIARLTTPDLPDKAVKYTRKVTKVWLVFFSINALVAAYTALFADIKTWTLYNGFIAYLFMGMLFSVEFLIRLRVQKSDEN